MTTTGRRCFKDKYKEIRSISRMHCANQLAQAHGLEHFPLNDTVLLSTQNINEPVHEISNNVVCATSKASDQPAHMRSLIRAFASRLSIL